VSNFPAKYKSAAGELAPYSVTDLAGMLAEALVPGAAGRVIASDGAGNWASTAPAATNPIAACTVASDGTKTNDKNITSVVHTGTGVYTITVTANTATKYMPLITLMDDLTGGGIYSGVTKTSATVWVVRFKLAAAAQDAAFAFALISND
jgi:hypothetical protein